MSYTSFMDHVTQAFEIVGVAVLVVGFVVGFVRALVARLRTGTSEGVYVMIRSYFGRSILLGLEVLVAADLIRTVAVDPTMQNVLVLGLIVLIRTFLSFSLEIEIDGVVPWRRWRLPAHEPPPAQAPPPGQRSEDAPRG
ncbi:MAG TPA: DUF1622 domain-containing protein [Thermoleophilia bacterium]|nr:DUF1622 domain-containing protein [Thermoleophilia bacterium]